MWGSGTDLKFSLTIVHEKNLSTPALLMSIELRTKFIVIHQNDAGESVPGPTIDQASFSTSQKKKKSFSLAFDIQNFFLLVLGSGKQRSTIHIWLHRNIRHQEDWSNVSLYPSPVSCLRISWPGMDQIV